MDEPRETVSGFAPLPHRLCEDPKLSDNAYRILGALMRCAHDRPTCYPSNETLGRLAGDKKKLTVIRGLNELEEKGVIRRSRDGGQRRRGEIEILWDALGRGSKNDTSTEPTVSKMIPSGIKNDTVTVSKMIPSIVIEGSEGEETKETPPGPPCPDTSLPDPAAPAPQPSTPSWAPGDPGRVVAAAERYFPTRHLGEELCRKAHLYPAEFFVRALEEAAHTGKFVTAGFLLGICKRYQAQGGPPSSINGAVGRSAAPVPPKPVEYFRAPEEPNRPPVRARGSLLNRPKPGGDR